MTLLIQARRIIIDFSRDILSSLYGRSHITQTG